MISGKYIKIMTKNNVSIVTENKTNSMTENNVNDMALYRETCLNRTSFGQTFMFGIDRCSVYNG
jgi:hypothetical protein